MAPCAPPGEEWLVNRIQWARRLDKPSYYDAPANKQLLEKCKISARNATVTSMFLGFGDAILLHNYWQVFPALTRIAHWALPSFGSFGAFIVGNALAVEANGGKDTPLCHTVGGFLFGAVWANHLKRPRLLWFGALPLAGVMYSMKLVRDKGEAHNFLDSKRINPNYVGASPPFIFRYWNWSLYPKFDPKRYEDSD